MKVLLTGATGFVGRHLLRALQEKGYKVRVLLHKHSLNAENIEIVQGSLLEMGTLLEATKEVDAVIHAAAVVSFHKKDVPTLMQTNVLGTAYLINACLENKVPRLLYIGSSNALGREQTQMITDEQIAQTTKNLTPYGISKMLAEREVFRGQQEGLATTILNPVVILGPGNWRRGTPSLFYKVYRGLRFYPLGSNGFVGVWDVVRYTLYCLEHTSTIGKRFLLCAENWTWKQLLTEIALALHKPPPRYPLQKTPLLFLSRLLEKVPWWSPPLTEAMVKTSCLNLSYKPLYFLEYEPISKVIRKTAALFLKDFS